MPPSPRTAIALAIAGVVLLLEAACARSDSTDNGDTSPTLIAPGTKNAGNLTVCVATECPPPWASCNDGNPCTTDTSREVNHCGSCGTSCPEEPPSFHATSVCSNGKCAIACDELSANCNHDDSDGCEVYTGDDPKNCGGCGIACKKGEICWKGACGCPSSFSQCGSDCKDLAADPENCQACNSICDAPASQEDAAWVCGPGVQPPHTTWGCTGTGCGMVCAEDFADCDGKICGDGCEVNVRRDPLNCGSCGRACEAGQDCVNGTCLCPAGTVRCDNSCIDVNVDPDNCGGCGNECPGASDESAHGTPICTGGRCGYLCYAGFADCNNRINDGCEANTGTDPLHCGGCSTKCDTAQSQPCVHGQCLTKPCAPAAGTF